MLDTYSAWNQNNLIQIPELLKRGIPVIALTFIVFMGNLERYNIVGHACKLLG